ncbi:starch-binding protein [Butyrivibrio sp. XPD2006]|uniref:starch-binding protein n=1 Tax=Butyrivibrio sp. XPD2006 TaxID=1280668 RepID=UPI0003B303A3|nr:starch-binding protein [Butyrivibrio sp. XPD2006]
MKKVKLWRRSLMATGLGLSVALSSLGSATVALAAEQPAVEAALEVTEPSEVEELTATGEVEDQTAPETDGAVNEEVNSETTEVNTETEAEEETEEEVEVEAETEAETEVEAEAADTAAESDTDVTSELKTQEFTITAAEEKAPYVPTNLASRDHRDSDNASVNRDNIHDGAILQAFCWSFNTIADNMADIADAGYTAVQTSPINECLDTNPGRNLHGPDGMWYYHYQPTDWVIGNYQLGSRDEFKHMCDVADEYGIAVIVDILPNHTTPSMGNVSENLIEAAGGSDALYHTTGMTGGGYSDRLELTYYAMGGLPDVDTENIGFQEYFYEFLKDCVYLGADGFRIDTAKHISLPDDPVTSDYTDSDRNTFYPNMREALNEYSGEVGTKSYDELFVYGEVLQGSSDRLAGYQEYIGGTTASNYGSSLRSALASGNLSVNKITDYQIYDETVGGRTYNADDEKLITWVESHDNYMNDSESCWKSINDEQVILGWSFIGARKAGTPLFFSRPDGSSAENPYGNNLIGEAGSDIYKAPEVKAVNLFRRQMLDADEYITNPGGNIQTVMVERKGADVQGAVIINSGLNRTTINAETVLEDGTYANMVEGSEDIFLVKDGIIYGSVDARSVAVLSDKQEGTGTVVSFCNSENWDNVVGRVDGETLSTVNDNDGWYWTTVLDDEFEITFENSDGSKASPAYKVDTASGTFATLGSDKLYFSKEEAEAALGIATYPVYFFGTEGWANVNVYGWLSDGTQLFGGWPGTAAANEGEGWWRADVKVKGEIDSFNLIFNNGGDKQTVNIEGITPESEDIYLAVDAEKSSGQLVVDRYTSKAAAEEAVGVSGSFTTAYFYNTQGWEQVCAYSWGAASLGEWPGTEMTQEEDGWYKIVLPAGASEDLNIIFNNGNNGKQTSDMKITDMKYRFFLHNGIGFQKYGSKKDAMAAIATGEDITYTTVYFYNEKTEEDSWQDVALYIYGGENGEYNNLIGGWPGKTMVREEGTNWYSVEVPTKAIETGTLTYIFNNNGAGEQLSDNKNVTVEKSFFTTSSTDGFESKDTVYEFLGIEVNELEDPENPDDPTNPDDPGQEVEPVDPTNPDEPGEVVEPDDPTDPETPEEPSEPEQPSQPDKPSYVPTPVVKIIVPVIKVVKTVVKVVTSILRRLFW